MADVLETRRRERDQLIELARRYVEGLVDRISLVAAAVVGSVARGDFNIWSDVDVVLVAALARGNPLAREAVEIGVVLWGEEVFRPATREEG